MFPLKNPFSQSRFFSWGKIVNQSNYNKKYYPFGSPMVGRGWEAGNTGNYRFGFNGKEMDDEVSVDGGHIAFEARIYDSRLGRFLSCDPLEAQYSYQCTYIFAHNNPIALIDFLGMGDPPFTEAKAVDNKSFYIPTASAAKAEILNGTVQSFKLANGDKYSVSYDKDGIYQGYKNERTGGIYPMRSSITGPSTVNMAITPDNAAVEADRRNHKGSSAYETDVNCFDEMESNSEGTFVSLGVSDVNDAANKLRDYCEANVCVIRNLIIDFHGYKQQSATEGIPAFAIGSTLFFMPSDVTKNKKAFTSMATFMVGDKTNVLMGHCNILDFHQTSLTLISSYLNNAGVIGHASYCMSYQICLTGNFANKEAQGLYYGDDLGNVGKWLMFNGNKVTPLRNVRFGTGNYPGTSMTSGDRILDIGHIYYDVLKK